MITLLRAPEVIENAADDCACAPERIRAVHRYLSERFPHYELRHFHAPTRSMEAGELTMLASHHVISLTRAKVLPCYVVTLEEFLAHAAAGIAGRLRHWDLADMLRSHRIVIVSNNGIFPL